MRSRKRSLLGLLSGGVAVQALVSGSSLCVQLLVIRHASTEEYGSYVLLSTAIVFATTLQSAFIQGPLVVHLTRAADPASRGKLIGALYRYQSRLLRWLTLPLLLGPVTLIATGIVSQRLFFMLLAGGAAILAALSREFWRMLLFARRLPQQVLRADGVFCGLTLVGTWCAALSDYPAAGTAAAAALAALAGTWMLAGSLWSREPWDRESSFVPTRELLRDGAWSGIGGAARFLFNQGYTYLVAATLNVPAVASLAATRLPLAPVSLLGGSVGPLMLPTIAAWNFHHSARTALQRTILAAAGLATVACVYLAGVWWARDWVFGSVLKKDFGERDILLGLWSATVVIALFRDQLMYFVTSRGRFRQTASVTFISACAALTTTFLAMRRIGAPGAVLGILTGESLNLLATFFFSLRELRRSSTTAPVTS